MRNDRTFFFLLMFLLILPAHLFSAQNGKAASNLPQIDVENYLLEATLTPDSHEFTASATITFQPLADTDAAVFDLSENASIQKVLSKEGTELDFGQDELGPGLLSIHFPKRLEHGKNTAIKVEFTGGFDRDRFSRIYSRDEGSAYIGMEGSYLLYSAKWFPVSRFLADRATATIQVTVPLGMTVVGPGTKMPVKTQGITETFGWTAKTPILPNSVVAGQYFNKQVQSRGFTVECFAREDLMPAIAKSAETLARIMEYYQAEYGPAAAGNRINLVEVDDRLATHSGMMGTVFITRSELSQASPPLRALARRAAYQWWMDTVGVQNTDDLWLVDGMSYLSAVDYIGQSEGAEARKAEINSLAVLALKFEKKSAVRGGLSLGYISEGYESVVAGKGAWVLNMLKEILGEAKFSHLIKEYVKQYAGKGGTTSGFQKLAEKIQGKELGWFIAEWIDSIGVPEMEPEYAILKTAEGFRVSGAIKQDRDLFRMPLEIEVVTGYESVTKTIELNGKSTPFEVNTYTMPTKIVLDPSSKVLRNSRALQMSVALSLGDDLKQKGDYVDAIKAYEDALKLDSHKSLAHYRLAEVFFQQSNLQSAANSFRDALNGDKDPKWIEVWCYIYLGKIYDILGQRQRAMAEYNKALNTKDETYGAQAEVQKWLAAPFAREQTASEKDANQEPVLK
jgi:aminopeptidase N